MSLPLSSVTLAAMLAYGAPLAGVLSGAVITALLWPGAGDLATVVGAGVGLASGAAFARRGLTRGSLASKLRPRLADDQRPRNE